MGYTRSPVLPETSERSPFVGLPGTANTLRVGRQGDRTLCQLNPMVRTVVFVAMGLVTAMTVGFGIQSLPQPPWTILLIALPLLTAEAWLVRKLLHGRKLEVARGELSFYAGGAFPTHRLRKGDVRAMRIETVKYQGEDTTCDNHLLVLETRDGETAWLCISTDPDLIRSFQEDCRKALGMEA